MIKEEESENTHTVTATITDKDDNGVPGIEVTFIVVSGPNESQTSDPNPVTDNDGQASFTYQGTGGQGTDEIQACYVNPDAEGEKICSQTVTKIWNPDNTPDIELSPDYELNLVGEEHTVTAMVTEGEVAVPGIEVHFNVTSGPNEGKTSDPNPVTDADGKALFTYTGTGGVDTDRIQACITLEQDICSNVVRKEWTEEIINLEPLRKKNYCDESTSHEVTATIEDLKGNLIEGVQVRFEIRQGPNEGLSAGINTNAQGQAVFSYDFQGVCESGIDIIRACFTNQAGNKVCTDFGQTFDNDAFKEWDDRVTPVCPGIRPQPGSAFQGEVGEFYRLEFTVFTELVGPFNFEFTGQLPPGLELVGDAGFIQGTPTKAGNWTFTITATSTNPDEFGCEGSREYQITIIQNEPPGPPAASPIPTNTTWGLMIMTVLFVLSALYMRRRGHI